MKRLKFISKYIIVITLLCVLLIISIVFNLIQYSKYDSSNNMKNIVFFGDSITEQYKLDKFFHEPYIINKGVGGDKTEDLLERIEKDVYQYNPSDVIILVGINDILHDINDDDILLNIETIVNDIKLNRPAANIFVESIYPINEKLINENKEHKVYNKNIKSINKEIKQMCLQNGVTYINVFDSRTDEEGNLKKLYTKEGLHLTNLGYLRVTSVLQEYIKK